MTAFATKVPELVAVKGGFRGRFRCGPGSRPYAVIRVAKKDVAEARAARMQDVLALLVEAKLTGPALSFLQDMAEAPSERALAGIERAARELVAEERVRGEPVVVQTFRQIALAFIDGSMRQAHPDCNVRALLEPLAPRTVEAKHTHLGRVNALVGHLPVRSITAKHCEAIKRKLVEMGLEHDTRRNTQLFVRQVLSLAVKPLGQLDRSPLDDDWVIPKSGRQRAFQYLHPSEDAAMMRCKKIPLLYRVLWAFLVRNGGRKTETLLLTWGDVTFATGKCNLDDTKTRVPRWWTLDPDVARALAAIKPPGSTDGDLVFAGIPGNHLERKLRKHLKLAGLDQARPELLKNSKSRRWLTTHDLRATFVTVAMATGWTEFEIMRRSGHETTTELMKYRRDVAELQAAGMTWFEPLDQLLGVAPRPEVAHEVARRGKFTVINGGSPRSLGTNSRVSQAFQAPKTPKKRPGAPGKVGHGPPTSGGVAQNHGPPTSDLVAAIANASAAGKWALVERLTAQLEGLIAAGSSKPR